MADIIKIADFATSIITKKSFQSSYEILRRGVADSGPHHVTSKKMSNVQRQFSVVKWQWRLFKPWIAVIQIHRPFKRLRRRTGVGSRSMLTRGGGGIGGRVVEGRSLLTELVSWWRLLDRRLALCGQKQSPLNSQAEASALQLLLLQIQTKQRWRSHLFNL